MSDSLQPHESQHTRPPCPSPTPGVHSDSCPLNRWCHPAISSSFVPFSSCPQSLPASGSFPMSQLFTWRGQNIGVSASFIYILIVYFLLSDNNETSYEEILTEGKRDKYQVNLKWQWIWVGSITQLLGLAQLINVQNSSLFKRDLVIQCEFPQWELDTPSELPGFSLLNGMLPVSTLSPLALSLPSFLGHTLPLISLPPSPPSLPLWRHLVWRVSMYPHSPFY